MSVSSANPTSLTTRIRERLRAIGIRCIVLLTALLLTVPTAEVISTSSAFAQTRDPSLMSVRQALAAALPSLTLAPAGDVPTTAPDPTVPPSVTPSVVPADAPTSTPLEGPADTVTATATSTPAASAPAVAPVQSVPEVAAVQAPAAAEAAAAAAPAPAVPVAADPDPTTAPSSSFPLSSAVKSFLAGLNISLPDGPVTGSLNGTTLTVTVGAPALPITLPIGAHPLVFSTATMTIDEATKSLSLSGTATTDNGLTANLTVTIGKVSTTDLTGTGPAADLSATVTITGVPVLGTVVDLTGTLSYSGGKPAASLTGTLAADAVVAANTLTIKSGSTITLSTTDGVTIDGSALVGSGDSVFTVGVKGEIHDPKTWSLDVSLVTDQTFTPIDGLTINPNFTGKITDAAGVVRFDLSSTETGSWTTGPVSVALKHVEVSNMKPADGRACSAIADGNLWFDVNGDLNDPAIHLSADANACVNATDKTFRLTTNVPTGIGSRTAGFTIDNVGFTAARDKKDGPVVVSGSGTLKIYAGFPTDAPAEVPVQLSISSDGSFVAGAGVDLQKLGLGTGHGTVLVSSAALNKYDATAFGVKSGTVNLAQGVTVVLDYQPSGDVNKVITSLKLPAPKAIQATASLGTGGFSTTVALKFDDGAAGAQLLGATTKGGASLNLNSLSLGLNLNATNASVTVAGSAFLSLPALYPGPNAKGSTVQVTLSGSLSFNSDSVGGKVGFSLESTDGWTDAFGIPGLFVQQVAGTVGISLVAGALPVPTMSFLVDQLQLPDGLAADLGVTPGTKISLSLAMDVTAPIVHFSIVGPATGSKTYGTALEPLAFANRYDSIKSAAKAIQISTAELMLAPLGGTDAAGKTVKAGATLVFDSTFGGVPAHVYANIGLASPSLTADGSVGDFMVGGVQFRNAKLHLSVDPAKPEASFLLSGGFTDDVTHVSFDGKIELGASPQLANAAIALHIAGGQPSYLLAQADLMGRVSFSPSAGFTFSATGSVRMYAAYTVDLGNVSFSYSSTSGALWQQLSQAPNVVANTFKQIYGWSDVKIAQELKSLKFTANDVAKGIGQGLNETNTQVTSAMYRAGYTADQTVQAVKTWGNATLGDIATGLNQAGATTDQIVSATKNAFGNSAATAYNTLQTIGQGGQGALTSVANFFNPGSYNISNKEHWYDVPMFFDVSDSSQAPDAHVIQWTLKLVDGYNQQWYVLPTDSGYAEIVNRNSGQCLSVYGNSAGPAPLVQYPCFGGANQQWLFSGGTSNLGGSTGTLQSRSSKLMVDVAGESATAGAWIDQWYANGHNNQLFTFTKAIG